MLYILISLVVVALDQWFKGYITSNIVYGATREFIPGIVSLTNVHNMGAAFSLFDGMRVIILVVTCIFCIAAVAALIIRFVDSKFGNIALAMLLGGAAGNAVDRIMNGFVVDMFKTEFINFAIFNIADCFITVGGILFCIYILLSNTKQQANSGKLSFFKNDVEVRSTEKSELREQGSNETVLSAEQDVPDTVPNPEGSIYDTVTSLDYDSKLDLDSEITLESILQEYGYGSQEYGYGSKEEIE